MTDIADKIAAQARELFAHLPDDEIGDTEALDFTFTEDGGLSHVACRGAVYAHRDGATWRFDVHDGTERVVAWIGGKMIGTADTTNTVIPTNPLTN